MPKKTFVQEMRELQARKEKEIAEKLYKLIKEGKLDKDNIKWADDAEQGSAGGEWNKQDDIDASQSAKHLEEKN